MNRSLFSTTRRFKAVHVIGLLIFISRLAYVQALPIDGASGSQLASHPTKPKKTVEWDDPLTVHFEPKETVADPPLGELMRLVAEEEDPDVYKSLPSKRKNFQYMAFSKASAKRFLKIAGKPLGWEMNLIDNCKWVNRAYCPDINCRIKFELVGLWLEADQAIDSEGWMDVSGLNGVMHMPAKWDRPGFFIQIEDGVVVKLEHLRRLHH
ncbi:hypothetical protein C8R42DRAFT_469312 [Lentinula raphanica]|nr:hypothetical protein C8R42DRAFT_469312 [Lentinula raphanica]